MASKDDESENCRDNGLCPQRVTYESLEDALDALDMGIHVDEDYLMDLAAKGIGTSGTDFESGRSAAESKNECTKNRGHKSFIPVTEFKLEHIPEKHRTQRYYEIILSWANLVVKVDVKRVSKNRPKAYSDTKLKFPNSEFSGLGTTRKPQHGSGYVVSGPNQKYTGQFCPCHLCRGSGQRREFWSLNIATAVHVIYDSSEARDSVFQFFYDSEDKTGVHFMYGTDSFEQVGKNTEKICIVRCVSHDMFLYEMLVNAVYKCTQTKILDKDMEFENEPAILISHPHGLCKQITVGSFVHFIVPPGNNFPVDRPISFTKLAECRLPPCEANKVEKESENTTAFYSNQSRENVLPLPAPIAFPSDIETYLETTGIFVINTGKNQNILSPGLFRRENHKSEILNKVDKDIDAETKLAPSDVVKAGGGTINGNAKVNANTIANFTKAGNFMCVNVDEDTVFTTADVYFGDTAPARDMNIKELKRQSSDPDPDVTIMYDNRDIWQEYAESINTNFGVKGVVTGQDHQPESPNRNVAKTENNRFVKSTSSSSEESINVTATPPHCEINDKVELEKQASLTSEGSSNDSFSLKMNIETKEEEVEKGRHQSQLGHKDETNNHQEAIFGSEPGIIPGSSVEKSENSADMCSSFGYGMSHSNNDGSNSAKRMGGTECVVGKKTGYGGAENDAFPLTALTEVVQMLRDEGVIPKSDNDTDSATEVGSLIKDIYAILHLDDLPLASTVNKAVESIILKKKTPMTLEPGSQFHLTEGMTFTLPKNAKFALRFNDLSKSWFNFPPGTMFHTVEGVKVEIPDNAEFSFRCQGEVQCFVSYNLDSCPGSSGGLVMMGTGTWNNGRFAHSGKLDDYNYNQSCLRRWMIHIYSL